MPSSSFAGTRLRRLIALLGALVLLPLAIVLAAAPAQAAAFAADGVVYDALGDPVSGVTVEALASPAHTTVASSTTTGASGDYHLSLTAGTYHLRFSKTGYETAFYGGGTGIDVVVDGSGDIAVDGEPVEDNALDDVTLVGTAQHAVTGTVRNAGTTALPGITVEAFAFGDEETVLDSDTTNGSGAYTLTLPDGHYQVRYSDPGLVYVTAWYDGTGEPVEITVTGPRTLDTVTLATPPPGAEFPIAGQVLDANGDPVDAVTVDMEGIVDSEDTGAGTTIADGSYSVSVLPGTYNVTYSKTNWVTTTYGGTATPSTITVAANGDVSVAPTEDLVANKLSDVTLASTPFAKTGTVETTGDVGLVGITVRAFPEGSTDPDEVVDTAVSAAGGSYTLDLRVGAYDLEFTDTDGESPTYTTGTLAAVKIAQGGALSVGGESVTGLPDVELALSSADTPHPVIGSVIDANGADVDGLTVTGVPQVDGELDSDETGADGAFGDHGRFRLMLKPGSYQIEVEGGSSWQDTTYVGEGAGTALVQVQLNGTVLVNGVEAVGAELGSTQVAGTTEYALSGTVKEGSTGLPGITVNAYAEDDLTTAVATTTAGVGGAWSLTGTEGLVVGAYAIELSGTSGGNTYDKAYFGGATPTPVEMAQGGVAKVAGSALVPANTLPDVLLTKSSADTPHPVTGEVEDANGDPLAGVTVTPSGGPTTAATTTTVDGYTLQLKPGTYTLTYTRSGFTTTTYPTTVTVELDGSVLAGTTEVSALESVALVQSAGTATVKGQVVAAAAPGTDGINGIKVELFPEGDTSGTPVKQATTATVGGVIGSWSVTTVPIGTYTIRFTDTDGIAPTYIQTYQGGADLASASPVKVGQGNAVTISDVPQGSGGALATTTMTAASDTTTYPVTGTVTDANGDPIQGATVSTTGGPASTPVTTNVDGEYAIQLKAGTYTTVHYVASGFTATDYPGSGETAVSITIQSGGTMLIGATPATGLALEDVSLDDATGAAAFSGRVTTGGSGLTGILVELFPEGDFATDSRIAFTTSGANGAWSFGSRKIGTYDVRFSGTVGGTTYVTTYYGGTTATPVKVGQGDVVSVGGSIKGGGALGDTPMTVASSTTTYDVLGDVADANGDAIAGVTVSVEVVTAGAAMTPVTTDSEGAYTLPLRAGTYKVKYARTGFTGAYLVDFEGAPVQVVVKPGGEVRIDDEVVAANTLDTVTLVGTTTRAVTGTVVNASSVPIAGITVTAVPDYEGNPTRTATTASNGTFTLNEPVGSYRISFNDNRAGSPTPRYQLTYYGGDGVLVKVTSTGLQEVDADGNESPITGLGSVTMAAVDSSTRYDLTGATYDPDYESLGGVSVTAVAVSGTPAANGGTTVSDSEGLFTVAVKPGKYQLRATKTGYEPTYLTGDDAAVIATITVSTTGIVTAPDIEDFSLPVDLQLLFPAAKFKTAPKLSGKAAPGQTVTTTFGVLQGAGIDKDYALVEWFLDGKPADDFSVGSYYEKFKVPASAALKKLTYRITIEDPDGLRAPTVYNSPAVAVGKAAAKVKGVFKKGKLTVTLTVPGLTKPTGTLLLKEGKKIVAKIKLKAKSKGKAVVPPKLLKKLKPGKHKLTLTYAGTKTINKAKSTVKVTIKK